MDFVCLDCGARQATSGKCGACGHDDTLDMRDEKVRELMRDTEERLERSREGKLRFVGVVIGIGVVVCLWMIPGYWDATIFIHLPVLFDQWLLMALIGFGAMKGLEKVFGRKRFPYLGNDLVVR